LVVGHTRRGAPTAAVELKATKANAADATGCQHVEHIVRDIDESIDPEALMVFKQLSANEREFLTSEVARRNVIRVVQSIRERSQALDRLVQEERIAIVGAMYDVVSGNMEFLSDAPNSDHAHAERTLAPRHDCPPKCTQIHPSTPRKLLPPRRSRA